MSERNHQLRQMLLAMATHCDVIADAYEGSVSGHDAKQNAALEKLTALGVLKPFEEGNYRLNPRLREFFADSFESFNAFQALRAVTGVRDQALEQWSMLCDLKRAGKLSDFDELHRAFEESLADIAYSIEHNLALLHSLIKTQYGNVNDLRAKMRQNAFYTRQVVLFLKDMKQVDAFVDSVSTDATRFGLPESRYLILRTLGSRLLLWTSQIKDAQAELNKGLFAARKTEERLKRLARFSLALQRNKLLTGWDLPVEDDVDASLLRTQALAFRPQVDVKDLDDQLQERLRKVVATLPRTRTVAPESVDLGEQTILEETEVLLEHQDPEYLALAALMADVEQTPRRVSLLTWKRERPDLDRMQDEAWLLYAGLQLKARKKLVEFTSDEVDDPFALNFSFSDAWVSEPPREAVR
ncbi:MAG TPA: hypothetical protein VMR43_10660 [Variovorax sp.]|nr:hypothetical protein [Variovorax sp.]